MIQAVQLFSRMTTPHYMVIKLDRKFAYKYYTANWSLKSPPAWLCKTHGDGSERSKRKREGRLTLFDGREKRCVWRVGSLFETSMKTTFGDAESSPNHMTYRKRIVLSL